MVVLQSIEVLLCNIQSHAQTRFTLEPGFNVIVSPGNNVGKSAILKALRCVAEAPSPFMDLRELLREGTEQGYVAFKFDGWAIIYWLCKKDTAAGVVIGFFEITDPDGQVTRSPKCPTCLLDALGIVLSPNGKPINFNDAAATQLLVQDNAESDEIISRVLVDDKVEVLKEGLVSTYQAASRDLKTYRRDLEFLKSDLQNLHYNEFVGEFEKLHPTLEQLAGLLDRGVPRMEEQDGLHEMSKLKSVLGPSLEVAGYLEQAVHSSGPCEAQVSPDTSKVSAAIRCLSSLAEVVKNSGVKPIPVLNGNIECIVSVCKVILDAILQTQYVISTMRGLVGSESDLATVKQELSDSCVKVSCPMKGEVYYSNEGCIPYRG